MPSWNSDQYLKFEDERTRPCRDLATRVAVANVQRVIDLGCGPGNSTAVLAHRWPGAELTALDSSAAMIEAASQTSHAQRWMVRDIAEWAANDPRVFDVVFANAALQWVPDHATLYPQLFARVAPRGALAVQVPGNFDAPAHQAMRELAESPTWRDCFPEGTVREWYVHDVPFYYDVLSPLTARIDLWETEYVHVMPDQSAIVEWYRGTGLRPFLDVLPSDVDREQFAADLLTVLRSRYPSRPDGRVLFPFRRIFLVAYRG